MTVRRIVFAVLLVGVLALTGITVATAQTETPMRPGGPQQMQMVGMAENIVVSIKDHGDSQTVLVIQALHVRQRVGRGERLLFVRCGRGRRRRKGNVRTARRGRRLSGRTGNEP